MNFFINFHFTKKKTFKSLQTLTFENLLHDFAEIVFDLKRKFKNQNRINEAVGFPQLDLLVLNKIINTKDRTLYRMIFKANSKKMFISSFDTVGKNWDYEKKMEINQYFNEQLLYPANTITNKIYLDRNLVKKRQKHEWFCKNGIEFDVIYCKF